MAPKRSVVVTQDPDAPVAKDVLATAIVKISKATDELHRSGLNEDAIVALIHDNTRLLKGTIRDVLNNLRTLESTYCVRKER